MIVAGKAGPAHAPRSPLRAVGVDVGVKDLLVVATADGVEVDRVAAPKPLAAAQNRLRGLQRQAARRRGPYDPDTRDAAGAVQTLAARQGTHRWYAPARVAAIRAHEFHPATAALATGHDVVVVEPLSAKNISRRGGRRKRGFNRALGDAALGRIRTQLDYKTTWYGAELVTAPRLFPSTQLCSRCGAKTKLGLRDRIYRCRNGCPPMIGI